jgi:hypothetical protein
MQTPFRLTPLLPLFAVATIACATATTAGPSGQMTGAPSARHAVEQFLAAVRAQDIQAMSVVWGTSRGPTRDNMDRNELERRAIILQCFLAHDQFRIVSETPGEGGRRIIVVAITRASQTRQPSFHAVPGPSQRWYVENIDLASVRDFCGDTGAPTGR